MPTRFERVFIESTGRHLPGAPIDNTAMDAYIATLNRMSDRIKRRILAENGITTRHYAIDADGSTRESHSAMAAAAVRATLARAGRDIGDIDLLAAGTSGADALMPGFASMLQGELGAPPMQTLSSHGICASGVGAWQFAAQGVELGGHRNAVVAAAEMPSRLFKRSRYAAKHYDADFDAHFLRWMLSDGAGALLLTDTPSGRDGVQLRLRWMHSRSFSGDYPVCMQLGLTHNRSRSHLDYDAWAAAEADGALFLRQDIRLLPHLFDIGVHEYATLAHAGWIDVPTVDHFLCHYSSERFAPLVHELMDKAGLAIPRERWYSNLVTRGNTGAASIFVMLDEFLETKQPKPGEKILCFIPESGRFTVCFALIEVEPALEPFSLEGRRVGMRVALDPDSALDPTSESKSEEHQPQATSRSTLIPTLLPSREKGSTAGDAGEIAPPHDPANAPAALKHLLGALATEWHAYRSSVWRTPLIRKLRDRRFTAPDYIAWMQAWIPQVREGSLWMREGAASITDGPLQDLAALIEIHAGDEQNDYMILFEDYRTAGGNIADIDQLRRNPGGEALNAYLHALAATPNPVGLLGAIYIIEGTGQRIIPALLPLMKAGLDLPPNAFRFLDYHGSNDEHHLARWLQAVELVLASDTNGDAARAILATARRTAQMYLMQFEHIDVAA